MSNRRARVGDRRRTTGKTPTKFGKRLFETLEPRRLLAVASLPSEPLNTVAHPIAVESGLIDGNATTDLVVLGRDGQLSVALNSGENSWQSAKTLPLELGAAYGMASGWMDADASLDLVVVGNDSAKVLLGDRRGGFQLAATLAAPAGAGWQPTDDNAAGIAVGNLDSDLALDVVLLDTQANRVFVWYGRGDGTFLPPQAFPSGGTDPISVAIGDVVGDPRPDIVVGHRDGSLSFLEGSDEREFRLNAEDTLHKADAIRSLAAGDVDQDGDWDVVGASGSEAWVLRRQPHPLATPPIVNGDFSEGLLGWKVESVGQQPGQPAGEVQSVGGMAQLTEHQSLLTTLSQSFIVPPDPQYLSLDLRSLGLEAASGAIPDALEFSLLGDAHGSLVPTHAAGATSFFNAVGQIEGTPQIHLASGVMYADGHVQLDISQLVPGEQATLFIDLVGQPPGAGATATVDNVSIVPERIFSHSFVAEALPGPFAQASSIRIGDVDGDHWKDIVVSDSGADRLFVFNGLASPIDGHNFSQSSIDVSSFGHRPVGLSLHRLDSDSVTDIAVALADSARVLTPLSAELVNAQEGRCLPTIDFETDAQGSPLVPGELLAEQFASWGIHVSARGSQLEPQIADWPTGGRPKPHGATTSDQVLILHQAAGGHDHSDQNGHHDEDGHHSGDGHHDDDAHDSDDHHGEDDHGGACGRYDQGDTSDDRHRNQTGRGHELARGKGHDSDHEDSHDSSHGHHDHPPGSGDEGGEHAGERGTLVFAFDSPVMLDEIVLLRTRSSDRATVSLFAADGSLIKSVRVESSNPTAAQGLIKQTVPLAARNVARMELTLDSSQALAEIVFCDEEAQDGRALIAGPSQVDEGTAATLELSSPGFHAVEWTITWGDGTIDELPGDPAHASHVFAVGPATHSVIATARDSAGNVVRSNRLTIAVADTSRVFPTLDFEHSATGAELRAGERITDQFASLGITVSTNRSDKQSAVIFDSSKASGSSRDLGSPNKRFGGPGQGSGGASGVGENRNALGNVLVISKSTKNVDANEAGGALVFQFDQPVRLAEVHLLDIDKPGSAIRLFTTDGALISSTSLADRGPNSFQIATLDASHVARMEIVLAGGGAVASIVSQRPSSGLSVQTITGSLASSPIAASSLTAHTASPDGLAIDGSTTAAADIAADVLGGVISIGQVVDGSLTSQEGTAEWTFPGIAGQQIYINFQELDNWLQSDLFAPDGQLVYSKTHYRASGLDSGTLTLPTSGNYKLRLTSTSSPSYRFQIFDIPGPDVQTAQLGTTNSGALDWPGRADHWTFEGSSGDRMFLDFLTLSTVVGGDLVVDVVAPSGTILSTRTSILPNSLDQGFTLTETGQYTLVLHAAFDGSQLPSYSFQLWQVPADYTDSLIYRQPVSGAIETPGARDQWQFEADAGQNVFLDFTAVAGGDLRFQLLEPNGELFSSVTFSLAAGLDREFILPASGRYTLLIDGAGTANLNTYQFVLWDIPPEIVEQATLNTTLSGTLVPGQSVPFEFQGNAGTPILLDVIESSSRALAVTLIQPDGQTLIDHAATNVLTSLPQTGTYRALVTSASQFALDAHGPYAFRIQDASAPKVGLPDSMGTEFVVAFPPNLREPFAPNNPAFFLSISSPVDTSGTVQIPGIGFTRSYSVTGGSTTTIALPSQVELSDSETITDKGILVTALDEVTVTGLDQLQLLTEGFTALPTDAVGSEYYVLGYSHTVT
ncbi:MAG: FG-GAP repeat domain-containing protein [Aureliella sp.]